MRKVVSLFSGGGGLDLGLEAAGFSTVFATDIDMHSCESLRENRANAKLSQKSFLDNGVVLERDIKQLSASEILEAINMAPGELDLLAGGPPCQAFSVFGKRKGHSDPRGQLVYEYLRLLGDLSPKAFVFENVYGLMTIDNGKVLDELLKKLEEPKHGLKYKVKVHRLLAADYGVPQMRDRLFIIGSRVGETVNEFTPLFCKKSNYSDGLLNWRSVKQALNGIPKIGHPKAFNHIGRKHSQRIIDRYTSMKFGERDHFTRINRLDPSRPSYTIIVGSDAGGGKGHIHPYEGREVTPRESARIQCFPDWYWFSGTSRHPIRQIGNAVPSLLGGVVGQRILEDIFGEVATTYTAIVKELDQEHLFSIDELKYLEEGSRLDQATHRLAI